MSLSSEEWKFKVKVLGGQGYLSLQALREKEPSLPLPSFCSLLEVFGIPGLHFSLSSSFTWCSPCALLSSPPCVCLYLGQISLLIRTSVRLGLILNDFIWSWSHLQRPCFPINSHSQTPGIRTSTCLLGATVQPITLIMLCTDAVLSALNIFTDIVLTEALWDSHYYSLLYRRGYDILKMFFHQCQVTQLASGRFGIQTQVVLVQSLMITAATPYSLCIMCCVPATSSLCDTCCEWDLVR